jgi:hypothetical protein
MLATTDECDCVTYGEPYSVPMTPMTPMTAYDQVHQMHASASRRPRRLCTFKDGDSASALMARN